MSQRIFTTVAILIFALFVSSGCRKKAPAPPPPPPPPVKEVPPPPKMPVVTLFAADPTTIERGQSSTLRWSVTDATTVTIEPGVGPAETSGARQVSPASSTTYVLRASGPGGESSASARVTVTLPPPPPPLPAPPAKTLRERLAEVQDAYFDFDKSNVRQDAQQTLTRNADTIRAILHDLPGAMVVIEGHCDERGSAAYNLGLGDRRANSAKQFLGQLGVPADRLKTISYGKERPQCTEPNEDCWQKNRRVHFSPGP